MESGRTLPHRIHAEGHRHVALARAILAHRRQRRRLVHPRVLEPRDVPRRG